MLQNMAYKISLLSKVPATGKPIQTWQQRVKKLPVSKLL